jgi:hypothetical protein
MSRGVRLLAALWLASAALPLFGGPTVVVVGITEGPDPIPRVIWGPADRVYPAPSLAPGRSDGRPDISFDPAGRPVVAWSYRSSAGEDVALLRWSGTAWGPVQLVTSGAAVERDPRAFAGPGDVAHVVWWVQDTPDRVFYLQSGGGGFGSVQLAATDARRPSVALAGTEVLLAYERTISAARQQIVLATRGPLGGFRTTPLFEVAHAGPVDVVLHFEDGRLWMDWKASPTAMAWSEYGGTTWSAPATLPWDDPSWSGTEDVRQEIREIVLAP